MHAIERYAQGSSLIKSILQANKTGERKGVFSVCSSNTWVIEASIRFAAEFETPMVIETTPNQVNQFGGYSGQTPAQFAGAISRLAQQHGLPGKQLLLGGDHLGPTPWQRENAYEAMSKSRKLMQDYVHAGYQKIHLDASMSCADDPPNCELSPDIAAERTAELCQVAEEAAFKKKGEAPQLFYVIGTEVPPAGGTTVGHQGIQLTSVEDVKHTLDLTHQAFIKHSLEDAWQRVIAVVVQPGVEFGDDSVHIYDPIKTKGLSSFIAAQEELVFEAHSTDYQTQKALNQLVQDHFCILKVGPELTFAFREAVFALALIEKEFLRAKKGIESSHLIETVEQAMLKDPSAWKKYYRGNQNQVSVARKFSYSDRIRYYWQVNEVKKSLKTLITNIQKQSVPVGLLSQFIPWENSYAGSASLRINPIEIIYSRINLVLEKYAFACGYITEK